jgi:hypothetical protein
MVSQHFFKETPVRYCVGFLIFFPLTLWSHDLGVMGPLWPVTESDIKQQLLGDANKTPWNAVFERLLHQADHLDQRFMSLGLSNATKTTTHYYDPSVCLQQDIRFHGILFYKKGTWVNPLKMHQPQTVMLFFNGNAASQRRFALAALKHYPTRLLLVLTEGNPLILNHQLHQPVYYANKALLRRFHLQAIPSLLSVGKGEHVNTLAITTFSPPFSVKRLTTCWSGCPAIKKGKPHA